ncbi:MAG: nitrous oxide reductase accessory protein NosL [Sulfurospirillaceae bacterium]|nr:nitrous oxide reductase accessory protein NosL [Sulfurospirillaceae bacterium]
MRILSVVLAMFFALTLNAAQFSKMPNKGNSAELIQVGENKEWCPICGMKLPAYYKTNHAVKLTDGTTKQYCSIRCLAVDMPAIKDRLKEILVVAVDTDKLINADSATYVIGSSVTGTMSSVSKLGFSTKEAALEFQKEHGGELSDFDTVYNKANESLENDVEMVQKRKEKMIYPKGKKLYEVKCQEIDPMEFNLISELKAHITGKNLCKGLKGEEELQPIALYLWEVARFAHSSDRQIDVPKDAKCPVCGMFVAKYPKWAAYIKNEKGEFYFDGVKDMMKFIFNPKDYAHEPFEIIEAKVTDYYTLEALEAKDAFYVVGSDVYGPMGNELIPFSKESNAKTFRDDHKGKQIVSFDEITPELVKTLD